jgi:hypothetical protein
MTLIMETQMTFDLDTVITREAACTAFDIWAGARADILRNAIEAGTIDDMAMLQATVAGMGYTGDVTVWGERHGCY